MADMPGFRSFFFFIASIPCGQRDAYPQSRFERTAILLPEKAGKIVFPHFRQFGEYLLCIHRSPLRWRDRMLCYKDMLAWLWRYRGRLRRDIQDVAFYLLRRIFPSTASRTRAAHRRAQRLTPFFHRVSPYASRTTYSPERVIELVGARHHYGGGLLPVAARRSLSGESQRMAFG